MPSFFCAWGLCTPLFHNCRRDCSFDFNHVVPYSLTSQTAVASPQHPSNKPPIPPSPAYTSRPRATVPISLSLPPMLTASHETPWRDIRTAAQTITSVMSTTNPIISYCYNSPSLLTEVPYGKRQLMSIYLHQLQCMGWVFSIDDGDKKCVGAAVWTGPRPTAEGGIWSRVGRWFKMVGLEVWMLGAGIRYRGAGMNGKVALSRVLWG